MNYLSKRSSEFFTARTVNYACNAFLHFQNLKINILCFCLFFSYSRATRECLGPTFVSVFTGPLLVTWTNGNSFTRSQASHICLRFHTGWRYVNTCNTLQSSIWFYQGWRERGNVKWIIGRKIVRKAKWCQLQFWMKQINDSPVKTVWFCLLCGQPFLDIWSFPNCIIIEIVFFLLELLQSVLWRWNTDYDQGFNTREQKATQS